MGAWHQDGLADWLSVVMWLWLWLWLDRLCGLVVTVPDYISDVLCFLWGTNWIYICYVEESRPPLWSSGNCSWLQIQRSWFDSWSYQIFWEVVGLERSPLSLVSTAEELRESKSVCSGLATRAYGRRNPSRWPRGTLYPQKLALTSPTSGGRSAGIVRSRTQATEFFVFSLPSPVLLLSLHVI
jgi:hypothetical protein